jgi:hypothetical protein
MIKVKLLDKFYNPDTSFYSVTLPTNETLFERIDESTIMKHRGSEQDVITKIALEYAESKGLTGLEVKFL